MLNPHLSVDDVMDRINDLDFEAIVMGRTQNDTLLRLLLTALEFMILYSVPSEAEVRRIEIIDTVMSPERSQVLRDILYRLLIGDDCSDDDRPLTSGDDHVNAFLNDFVRTRKYRVVFYEDHPSLHLEHGEMDFIDNDDNRVISIRRYMSEATTQVVPVSILGNNTGLHDSELVMRLWLNELSIDVPDRYYDTIRKRQGSTHLGCRHLHRLPVTDLQLSALRAQWFDDVIHGRSQTDLAPRHMEHTHSVDAATVTRLLTGDHDDDLW